MIHGMIGIVIEIISEFMPLAEPEIEMVVESGVVSVGSISVLML